MSSPGQRRGSCGHAMAGFDAHSRCARCRDKGLGDDPWVLKKECVICKGFTPEQTLQLATRTYRDRKEKQTTSNSTTSSTPTLVDPAHVSVLGKVEKVKAVQSTPTKKTKRSESPKPSASKKRSLSSRPSTEDLKQLDDKWAERFSRLEAMLLAKTFTVPVEPVVKPASDVTPTQKPFFDPGATTSNLPVEISLPVEKSGPCLDQATGIAVEEMQTATQPLGAPGAGIATQPVQAPGSFPEVQPTGEVDLSAASDSEADQFSETGSLDGDTHWDRSAEKDASRDDPETEPTEEANYTITSQSKKATPPETLTTLASSGISSSKPLDPLDGMGCMLKKTVRVLQFVPGHRILLNSTTLSAGLPEEICVLLHPPEPSVRISSDAGRGQLVNRQ